MKPISTVYNFEKEFYKEVRDKKRTASGVHKMRGKRGYVGKMFTTLDYLRGKEKREYTKAGKVVRWNMYKELTTIDEFKTFDEEQQKKIIKEWRNNFTSAEIYKGLGITQYRYYKMLDNLGVQVGRKGVKPIKENNASEIMPYNEFRRLDLQDRYYYIEDLTKKHTIREIGDKWNIKPKSVQQVKYLIKKKMKEKGLPLNKPNEEENSTFIDSVNANEKVNNLMSLYQEDKEDDEKAMKKEVEADSIQAVEIEPERLDKVIDLEENRSQEAEKTVSEASTDFRGELDSVKKEIADMVNMRELEIDELKEKNKELESRILTDSLTYINSLAEEDKKEVSSNADKSSGMTFNYNDEREGFLLHQDIKNFISMLEKNPSSFRVEMKITSVNISE